MAVKFSFSFFFQPRRYKKNLAVSKRFFFFQERKKQKLFKLNESKSSLKMMTTKRKFFFLQFQGRPSEERKCLTAVLPVVLPSCFL